jgi:hypothetical protein
MAPSHNCAAPEPCVILNKRSERVRQPGDLCCPGGSVEDRLDPLLVRLLRLPVSPLARWPYWHRLCREMPETAARVALLLTAGARESLEEMKLNPLRLEFLGVLPPQRLVVFDRLIHPLVVWTGQRRFLAPNWEVERVLHVPLRRLFDRSRYARYRPSFLPCGGRRGRSAALRHEAEATHHTRDFPCFVIEDDHGREILWGVTFRIVMCFMEYAFGFEPPDVSAAPRFEAVLCDSYLERQE